ncbi:umecyanin [Ricinus communis]|uniref:Cucumber peeling cupredoxin, putative n=1 Tax=Ricinus communis TaxID=3988 RepID=B9S3J7_RICCO|nr:umecyanin [Ricinus communis]EEF41799.1 Cucumber peeling cupredoxin, putative [Ricinus communis]|eukprot:XP_002520566.1 umecyanin [Ricinus communis]
MVIKTWAVAVAVVIAAASLGEKRVGAEVHHVVGEDRGWDPSTDVASWLAGRTFRVGDKLWFAYSASHGAIAELKTEEEYMSCDVSNPIKILTDGLDSILLDGEGIRYFVSSNLESCKKGLRLPVDVISQDAPDAPKIYTSESSALTAAAAGPTPSSSGRISASFVLLVAGFWLSYMLM